MASFLRSFGLGFVSAANRQFDERRRAQAAKDAEFAKIFTGTLAARSTANTAAAKSKKDRANTLAIAQKLGMGGVTQAAIAGEFIAPEKAFEFFQDTEGKFKDTQFTPGQEAQASLFEQLRSQGVPAEKITQIAKERGINLTAPGLQGQAAVAPQVTGLPEGFTIQQALQSPETVRTEKLATAYMNKPQIFTSNKDFAMAKQAFQQGDFETVIDLSARSANVQNNIFLPILDKILVSGINSLNPNERVLLDLYKPRDPLDQMMNMFILQNPEMFETIMEDALKEGSITEPPGTDATDEDRIGWWEQNIGPTMDAARGQWNKIIRGQ